MVSWRLVKAKHADSAFDGEGARRHGGRFNSMGIAVVYTSASLALAELEVLVNLPTERLLSSYVAFRVECDDALVETLAPEELPTHWRRDPAPRAVKEIGDAWIRSARSLVLEVPSAVVPHERNFLLNPRHPEAETLSIEGPMDPGIDPRLTNPA